MQILLIFIFAGLIISAIVLYNSFSWGYVASVIYSWFILPTFSDAPNLTWIQLAAIMFFINCFVHNSTTQYIKDEYKDNTHGLISTIIAPWMTLLAAWIFKIFLF